MVGIKILIQLFLIIVLTTVMAAGDLAEKKTGRTEDIPFQNKFLMESMQKSDEDWRTVTITENDLVVGWADSNEVVTISGNYNLSGNIIILNNGQLNITNAVFSMTGNIYVLNDARLILENSHFIVWQEFIYQYGATLLDNALFRMTDSQIEFGYQSWGLGLVGQSSFIVEQTTLLNGFVTVSVFGSPLVQMTDSTVPSEYVIFDEAGLSFTRSDYLLLWLGFPEFSQATLELPDGDMVPDWSLSDQTPNVQGIDYSVTLDSCTHVFWNAMLEPHSDVEFLNTDLRVVGVFFTGGDSLSVSNIINNSIFDDDLVNLADRNFHLVNCSVETWNMYSFDSVTVSISNSILGEILALDSSYVSLNNSIVDGTGGYVGAESSSILLTYNSNVLSPFIARDRSFLVAYHSSFFSDQIIASDRSVLGFFNSISAAQPAARDTSIAIVMAINPLPGSTTDSFVSVTGTCDLFSGGDNPWEFSSYRLYYAHPDSLLWHQFEEEIYQPVYGGNLGNWNTWGLESGNYLIKLEMSNNFDDVFEVERPVLLLPGSSIPGDVNNDGHLDVSDIVLLIGFILGEDNPDQFQIFTGDLNGDGILNVLDIVIAVDMILG